MTVWYTGYIHTCNVCVPGYWVSQLGHGDRNNVGLPRKVEALEGHKVVSGAGGGAHTLLLTGTHITL